MKRPFSMVLSLVVSLNVAACEKAHEKGNPGVDPGEATLFAHLPAGQTVLFGGNYAKLQGTLESLVSSISPLVNAMGSGGQKMTKWTTCFGKLGDLPKSKWVGGARMDQGAVQLYVAMSGITVDDIVKCSTEAEMTPRIDPDKKFVVVEIPQMAAQPGVTLGYLVLPDGSLYTRESFKLGSTPTVTTPPRAELEADIAALSAPNAPNAPNAAAEPLLASLGGKVDRSKTIWFIASGANTELANKLGEIYGTFDLTAGMAIDVTAQVMQKADADQAEQSFKRAQAMADGLPGEFRDIVKSTKLDRNNDRLRLQAMVSMAQLKSMFSQLGAMMPTAAGTAH